MKFNLKKLDYKSILIKLGITIVSVIIILWTINWVLKLMTRHGEAVELPSVKGLTYEEAVILLEGKDFHCEISDSLYVDGGKKNQVVEQDPEGGSLVKPGRMVYLKVNCLEVPMVEMPNVEGTLREAINKLARVGLKLGDTIPMPSEFFSDQVMGQRYQGKPITEGTKIPKGSFIDLVVSRKITHKEGGDSTDATDQGH